MQTPARPDSEANGTRPLAVPKSDVAMIPTSTPITAHAPTGTVCDSQSLATLSEIAEACVNAEPPKQDDIEARKLWFSYISNLNNRELQRSRTAGVTTWGLLAVGGAIAYRGLHAVPHALKVPNLMQQLAKYLVLEANVALSVLSLASLILVYCSPESEKRLRTELAARASFVFILAVTLVTALPLVIGDIWLFQQPMPRWTKAALIFSVFFCPMNILAEWTKEVMRRLKERKHSAEFPYFTNPFTALPRAVKVLTVMLVMAWTSLVVVALFRAVLVDVSLDWVTPVSAAFQVLVLNTIFYMLFFRALRSVRQDLFLQLETDIVCSSATVPDIEKRFIDTVVGPDIAEWLDEVKARAQQCQKEFVARVAELNCELDEVDRIDPKYQLEVRGRLERVATSLEQAYRTVNSAHETIIQQLESVPPLPQKKMSHLSGVTRTIRETLGLIKQSMKAKEGITMRMKSIAARYADGGIQARAALSVTNGNA